MQKVEFMQDLPFSISPALKPSDKAIFLGGAACLFVSVTFIDYITQAGWFLKL
jgi:hypothetical protein